MTTALAIALGTDIVAITTLAYGIYFRRHFRKDLLLSFVALNMGVLVVTSVLTTVQAGLGLGLGLFGILSIIRLRSDQITQEEIAYYFVSLAMGLLAGLHPGALWVAPAFMALLIAVMYVADHPRLMGRSKRTRLTLDAAYVDEASMRIALEEMLPGASIRHTVVAEVDLVKDITIVDVRYQAPQTDHPTTIAAAVASLRSLSSRRSQQVAS